MNDKALIIFIKNPVAGKVKTRLAKDVGDGKALEIYRALLQHTMTITKGLNADKYLYYSDEVDMYDNWDNNLYQKHVQDGATLGDRMSNAFKEVFGKGHKYVAIIGSDCLQISTPLLSYGLSHLYEHNTIIGPTYDGGYYLLGMNRYIPELFENKQWSTDTVFNDTVADIKRLKLTVASLPVLSDVDEVKDVPPYLL